jgi:heme exporter protein C
MQQVSVPGTSPQPAARPYGDPVSLGLGLLAMLSMVAALYAALVYAPTERVQGDVQRIFYVHVPLAWTAYLAFFVVFVASIGYLWKRKRIWDAVARSSAEVGLLLTTLMLIAGSLWARPIWGTWWTWDARLTLTLFLFFLFVGYLALRAAVHDPAERARFSAVVGILGLLLVPFIHLSVYLFRTLHPQPIVLKPSAPSLPEEMLRTLLISTLVFTLLYVGLVTARYGLALAQDLREEGMDA